MSLVIERWLLPEQLPGRWVAPTPIDLLPLLRHLYPGCIDEGILALQLVNPAWPSRTDWALSVTTVHEQRLVDVTPVSQDQCDGYNFSDWSPQEFPFDLIRALSEPDRVAAWQETVQLFRPEAFDMLQRVHDTAWDMAAEQTERPYARRQAFLHAVASLLAANAAASFDLVPTLVESLRQSEAFGVRSDEHASLWEELGAEAFKPSLLYEMQLDDLTQRVWSTFCELPRATQVAVWFHVRSRQDFPSGSHATDWEAPTDAVESLSLSDMDDYCRAVAARIMRAAEEDYFRALEGS